MIQAIVYDAVGTLIHVQPSVGAIYATIGQRFGSRLSASDIHARFGAAFAQQDRLDEQADWRTDEARERQRWRDIVGQVLDDVADPAGCFDALFAAFAQPDVWTCDPEAAEVLTHFQRCGVRQAIASNFDARLHAVITTMPALALLDPILISSEIGWRKPSPAFFAHLAERLQLPAREILYVGDDRANDYEPARQAGMVSVLLDPRRRHLDVGKNRLECLAELVDRPCEQR
jgi:putative hydrolase of the HAD superfamily